MDQVIVCVKQVPDPTKMSQVPIDAKTGTILRAGIPSILNPLDRHAVEEALRLREVHGGVVTVISMGPRQARTALEDTMIMGADRAFLLSDPAFAGSDTLATSYVLAQAIKRLGTYNLVICGMETSDSGTGHIAASLAEWLDLPQVICVRKLEIKECLLYAERVVEDGYQEWEATLPAVLSVTKDINTPRSMRLRSVAGAAAKRITTWGVSDLDLDPKLVGLAGSPTQVLRVFRTEPRKQADIIEGPAPQAVDALVARLRELRAI